MAWVSDVVFSALVLATGALSASTLALAVAWVRARERAIRAEQRAAPPPDGDTRFDRLERAVDAMAVEVERMSEGQRFLGRLLAERPGSEWNAGGHPERAAAPR